MLRTGAPYSVEQLLLLGLISKFHARRADLFLGWLRLILFLLSYAEQLHEGTFAKMAPIEEGLGFPNVTVL